MKIRAPRIFFCSILALTFTSTGCSWFGSGSGESEDGALSESDLAAQREGRFGAGNIPTAEGEGLFRDIHFGFDSYAVDGAARNDLEANARTMTEQTQLRVVLEGHCDERGTCPGGSGGGVSGDGGGGEDDDSRDSGGGYFVVVVVFCPSGGRAWKGTDPATATHGMRSSVDVSSSYSR